MEQQPSLWTIPEEAPCDGPQLNVHGPEPEPAATLNRAQGAQKPLKKSHTAPAMTVPYVRRGSHSQVGKKLKPPLESSGDVVKQAGMGLAVYLTVGVVIYILKSSEFAGSTTLWLVDGLYFSIVTMCTIGYGDITPVSTTTKLYCCAFVLVGFGFIDILLSGMVAYILERQEALFIETVEGGHHDTARRYLMSSRRGCVKKRMKTLLAIVVVASCLAFGSLVIHTTEKLSWLDSLYLSCMSVTTVGYGDSAFSSLRGRMFASVWLLVSSLAVARAFLYLAEERINKRNRKIAKWVMRREMTINDLVAADMDNDGYVSKSEYVVYKLRELGKISDEDIQEISRQFNILDSDNTGRITLSCLS